MRSDSIPHYFSVKQFTKQMPLKLTLHNLASITAHVGVTVNLNSLIGRGSARFLYYLAGCFVLVVNSVVLVNCAIVIT